MPSPRLPRGLTCKAHGAEQFLELLELPRGQEQVQEAHLPGHLQLRAQGAAMALTPADRSPANHCQLSSLTH